MAAPRSAYEARWRVHEAKRQAKRMRKLARDLRELAERDLLPKPQAEAMARTCLDHAQRQEAVAAQLEEHDPRLVR